MTPCWRVCDWMICRQQSERISWQPPTPLHPAPTSRRRQTYRSDNNNISVTNTLLTYTGLYYSSWRQCENWPKRTKGGGVICRKNVWNFAQGLKFKAVFHSKTSVCRHELGRVQPPSPTVLTLVDDVWSVSQQLIHITTNDFIEVWMSSIHVRK